MKRQHLDRQAKSKRKKPQLGGPDRGAQRRRGTNRTLMRRQHVDRSAKNVRAKREAWWARAWGTTVQEIKPYTNEAAALGGRPKAGWNSRDRVGSAVGGKTWSSRRS
jgi:hypothetical protein